MDSDAQNLNQPTTLPAHPERSQPIRKPPMSSGKILLIIFALILAAIIGLLMWLPPVYM
jgi:hypothetical protein